MQTTIQRNLLKYAAGRAIFCPSCGTIMDARRTVIITHGAREIVRCAACYDSAVTGKALPDGVEVLDGRVLWPRSKAKAKATAPDAPRKLTARTMFTRQAPDKRHYPKFTPGMTTSEYIAQFNALARKDHINLAPVRYTYDNSHAAPMLDPTVPEFEHFED